MNFTKRNDHLWKLRKYQIVMSLLQKNILFMTLLIAQVLPSSQFHLVTAAFVPTPLTSNPSGHKIRLSTFRKILKSKRSKYAFVGRISSLLATPSLQIFFDSTNHWHRDLRYHAEQPQRIEDCIAALQQYGREADCGDGSSPSFTLVDVATEPVQDETKTIQIERQPFSPQELEYARTMLVKAHSEEYVFRFEKRCRESKQKRIDEGKDPLGFVGRVDDDTYITTETYDVCLRATAAWIRAVDNSVASSSDVNATGTTNNSNSIALTRPPGHHATKNMANGFCIFNFCAVAALHATEKHGLKVSIFDWDVHYGQGVVDIVKGHDQIRYASIHQTPAFPYMGEKRGITQNILAVPIIAETSWTCGYESALKDHVLPFLFTPSEEGTKSEWKPDLVIVSAGYDALDSDDLASVSLQAKDFGRISKCLMEETNRQEKKVNIVFGLEGGYQLSKMAGGGNMPDAVVETVKALSLD